MNRCVFYGHSSFLFYFSLLDIPDFELLCCFSVIVIFLRRIPKRFPPKNPKTSFRNVVKRMSKEVRVIDIARKNVVTCKSDERLPNVAKLMLDHWIGSVLVVDDNQKPLGIVTDGILFNLIAKGRNPSILLARDVMVKPVHTVHEDTYVSGISDDQFLKSKVNRLTVVNDEGKLVGVLSRKVVDRSTKYSVARRFIQDRG
jgi:CBS domain-containing protein